ncbi:transcription termination factor Rho [Cephaloticoccus capnophilus]|uniref:transcription termination factor Rho n=1 Tax=Cephaloticoccus capnophilus TaxID=1548208 RepID=UPI0009EDFA29|nr:transcription termination factor Rho [Cephaloticoccus capnophilus]
MDNDLLPEVEPVKKAVTRKPRAPRTKKTDTVDSSQTLLEVLVPQAAAPAEKPKRGRPRKKPAALGAAETQPEASAPKSAKAVSASTSASTEAQVASPSSSQDSAPRAERSTFFKPEPNPAAVVEWSLPERERPLERPSTQAVTEVPASPEAPLPEAPVSAPESASGNGNSNVNGGNGRKPPYQPNHFKNNGQQSGAQFDRDRDSWKKNKRSRSKKGGKWQPGGGGNNSGPAHPQQPGPAAQQVGVQGDLPDPSRFEDLAALDALAAGLAESAHAPIYLDHVYALALAELNTFARSLGITFEGTLNRAQLIELIFKNAAEAKRPLRDRGYIDINAQGAFIVHTHVNYRLYPEDAWLPECLIKRYGLKRGHRVEVLVAPPSEGERCPAVVRIESVMGGAPEEISKVTPFEELVPYYPLQRILLEAPAVQRDVSMRAVDILTPIGFGQRGLIVAPPRTGKTILLQNIANSVAENFPDYTLILLLIDERPEEVTDFRRHTKGEVVSSTFDEAPESHVHCAEMVGEKARRLVEQGKHVVILLDSITRLARAYNALASNSGKIMSGGMEATALQKPKRFFGAARNIEGAGSLTIIGTALVDTGSRMDEVIFEEFKGTGNMELHLDRGLVERRIFPAINIDRSGTRKEELIYHPEELQKIYGLRRAMQGLGPIESMEMLIKRLKATKSNAEFLLGLR